MRHRSLTPVAAALALLLLVPTVTASAPASGQWAAISTAAPAAFGPGRLTRVKGSKIGPDGQLYVYGTFDNAGGDPTADNLAVYNPVTDAWHGLGSDGDGNSALSAEVFDIAWYGGSLIVAGDFSNAGGVAGANYIAAWNGSAWSRRGVFSSTVNSLSVANGVLYAAGDFLNTDGLATADMIAAWDGYTWTAIGSNGAGNGPVTAGWIQKVVATPDGRVFIGGNFANAGGNPDADNAAWWDPGSSSWQSIGGSAGGTIGSSVTSLAVSGNRVDLIGSFQDAAGDLLADYIVEWTGVEWRHLGSNLAGTGGSLNSEPLDIAVYGANLIITGTFIVAGGATNATGVAAWNGSKWLALGAPNPSAFMWGVNVVGRTAYATGQFRALAGITGADGIAAYGLPAAPSAPRAPKAVAGSKKVSLNWTAPLSANGSTLTDYVVQYRKVGAAVWTTFADGVKTTRTAVVTKLKTGTSYQFRVLAKNDWGTGAASPIVVKKAG